MRLGVNCDDVLRLQAAPAISSKGCEYELFRMARCYLVNLGVLIPAVLVSCTGCVIQCHVSVMLFDARLTWMLVLGFSGDSQAFSAVCVTVV